MFTLKITAIGLNFSSLRNYQLKDTFLTDANVFSLFQRQDMGDGVHGSQVAGAKRSVQIAIKPDTATVTILPQLTVGAAAAEVIANQ